MNSMVWMSASIVISLTYCMQDETLELMGRVRKALPLKA